MASIVLSSANGVYEIDPWIKSGLKDWSQKNHLFNSGFFPLHFSLLFSKKLTGIDLLVDVNHSFFMAVQNNITKIDLCIYKSGRPVSIANDSN